MNIENTETIFEITENETICSIKNKEFNITFVGTTICAKEDLPFRSELVGKEIAFKKAMIKQLKFFKKIYKEQKRTLDRALPQNYRENNEEYCDVAFCLKSCDTLIKKMQEDLSEYIKQKDWFYKKLSKVRSKNVKATEEKSI